MLCANCQTELKPDAKFCGKCGTPVTGAPTPTLTCLVCGAVLKSGVAFCGKCGSPVQLAESDVTVILPKKSSAAPATAAHSPMEAATVIVAREKTAPKPSGTPARADSLALELARQRKTATVAGEGRTSRKNLVLAAVGGLFVVGAGAWFLLRDTTPARNDAAAPAVVQASGAESVPSASAPVMVEESLPEPTPVATAQQAAPTPEAGSSVAKAEVKPVVRKAGKRKASDEELYLRQVRRQLEQR